MIFMILLIIEWNFTIFIFLKTLHCNSNMFIILSKLPDIPLANEDDIITEDVYWFVFVIFTNASVFFTNICKEPVPFSTISKTISKLLFEAVRYVDAIDAVVI